MASKRLHDGPCCKHSLSSALSEDINNGVDQFHQQFRNPPDFSQQFTKLNYLGNISCEFSQQTYNYKVRGEVDDHVSNSGFQHLWMGKPSTICKKVLILTKWSNLEALSKILSCLVTNQSLKSLHSPGVQSKFRSTSCYCCSHMQTSENFLLSNKQKRFGATGYLVVGMIYCTCFERHVLVKGTPIAKRKIRKDGFP